MRLGWERSRRGASNYLRAKSERFKAFLPLRIPVLPNRHYIAT
nr:MAG TPA: hypothetical protein [Caudoviricetes sp.]